MQHPLPTPHARTPEMVRRAQAVLAVTAHAYGLPLLERHGLAVREPSPQQLPPPPPGRAHERALEAAG